MRRIIIGLATGGFVLWLNDLRSQESASRRSEAARDTWYERGYSTQFPSTPASGMISRLRARGISSQQVLRAMTVVRRENFVPKQLQNSAYDDSPLPIGYGQTISQPFVVAFMTEELNPKKNERVLEIGTGSGYHAAVISQLVNEVYTIEIVRPLALRAESVLRELGYNNVHVKAGDGYKGWPEHAPFDAILVTAAPNHIPLPLVEQLKEGGRMVIPVGGNGWQKLYLLEKRNGKIRQTAVLPVKFVPLTRER